MSVRTSTCVGCATPIIGERLRCPACHDRHVAALIAAPGDEDMTVPRQRYGADVVKLGFLARRIVVVELCVIIGLGLILGTRGCMP